MPTCYYNTWAQSQNGTQETFHIQNTIHISYLNRNNIIKKTTNTNAYSIQIVLTETSEINSITLTYNLLQYSTIFNVSVIKCAATLNNYYTESAYNRMHNQLIPYSYKTI